MNPVRNQVAPNPQGHSPQRRRTGILIVGALAAVLAAYLGREPLVRAAIATGIYRAHVFTPPQALSGESRWDLTREDALFFWDVAGLKMARDRRLGALNPELKRLVREIGRHQAAGQGMQYSMHIYREIRWRMNFTPDVKATRARMDDLRRSLDQPEEQRLAAEQQSSDGSWGLGINVWFLRLYYSVEDGLDGLNSDPRYRLAFLDPVNSPGKLGARLDSVLHDNFTRTGVFNREELDETFSALARLLFGSKRTGYAFDPRLRGALRDFVDRWQNPATGCWGQWMVDRYGRTWKMDDMAMTFHVVSDLHGKVGRRDLIAKRLLQLDRAEFPSGIRIDGRYENHLNWDAVKVFRIAWPDLDGATREQVRAEISRMLDWCLSESLQPDGSFKEGDLDDTLGDAFDYGVYFLRETGYFRREDRFWTDLDFAGAGAVHDRIEAKLKATGLNDPGLRDAYGVLEGARP